MLNTVIRLGKRRVTSAPYGLRDVYVACSSLIRIMSVSQHCINSSLLYTSSACPPPTCSTLPYPIIVFTLAWYQFER